MFVLLPRIGEWTGGLPSRLRKKIFQKQSNTVSPILPNGNQ
jgi:hypothetical protein